MDQFLPDFLDTRLSLQEKELECDDKVLSIFPQSGLQPLIDVNKGNSVRSLTRSEVSALLASSSRTEGDASATLLQRKLKLLQVY